MWKISVGFFKENVNYQGTKKVVFLVHQLQEKGLGSQEFRWMFCICEKTILQISKKSGKKDKRQCLV